MRRVTEIPSGAIGIVCCKKKNFFYFEDVFLFRHFLYDLKKVTKERLFRLEGGVYDVLWGGMRTSGDTIPKSV